MVDPEFDQDGTMVVWQENPRVDAQGRVIQHGRVSLAPVDPDTGNFLLDQRIDFANATPVTASDVFNGPEWGQSVRGGEVYFTSYSSDEQSYAIKKIFRDGRDRWRLTLLPVTYGTGQPWASRNPVDPVPYLRFTRYLGSIATGLRPDRYGLRLEVDPPLDIDLPPQHTGGTWIPGTTRFAFGLETAQDELSMAVYEAVRNTVTVITSLPKGQSVRYTRAWLAPEWQDRPAIMIGHLDKATNTWRLTILRETPSGAWATWDEIPPLAGYTRIHSPEPFVVNGRSFVSAVSANGDVEGSQVWIASIGPETEEESRLVRVVSEEVSGSGLSIKNDPEPLVVREGSTALVYYQDFGVDGDPNAAIQLIACETGL